MNQEKIKTDLIALYNSTFGRRIQRKTYMDEIGEIKSKHPALFHNLSSALEEDEKHGGNENFEFIAHVIPEHVLEVLATYSSKRKRGIHIIDNNMNMVCFFIPTISSVSKELGERIVEVWNDKMPEYKLKGASTAESINSGFKKGLCYITTAVCSNLNKGDDCLELTLLREYRDQYLLKTPEGQDIVSAYYDVAPTIVNRINKEAEAKSIYQRILATYIQPCVQLIKEDKKEECKTLYSEMLFNLEKKYM